MQITSYQRYKVTCCTGVTLSLWVVRNFVHVSLHSSMTVQAAFESLTHFAVRVNKTGAASLTHKPSPRAGAMVASCSPRPSSGAAAPPPWHRGLLPTHCSCSDFDGT